MISSNFDCLMPRNQTDDSKKPDSPDSLAFRISYEADRVPHAADLRPLGVQQPAGEKYQMLVCITGECACRQSISRANARSDDRYRRMDNSCCIRLFKQLLSDDSATNAAEGEPHHGEGLAPSDLQRPRTSLPLWQVL